jgi:hypothetical protein
VPIRLPHTTPASAVVCVACPKRRAVTAGAGKPPENLHEKTAIAGKKQKREILILFIFIALHILVFCYFLFYRS